MPRIRACMFDTAKFKIPMPEAAVRQMHNTLNTTKKEVLFVGRNGIRNANGTTLPGTAELEEIPEEKEVTDKETGEKTKVSVKRMKVYVICVVPERVIEVLESKSPWRDIKLTGKVFPLKLVDSVPAPLPAPEAPPEATDANPQA